MAVNPQSKAEQLALTSARKKASLNNGVPESAQDFFLLNPNATKEDLNRFAQRQNENNFNQSKLSEAMNELASIRDPYTVGEKALDGVNALAQGGVALGEALYGAADLASRYNLGTQLYEKATGNDLRSLDEMLGGADWFFEGTRANADRLYKSDNQQGIDRRRDRQDQEFTAQSDLQAQQEIADGGNAVWAEAKNIARQAQNTAGSLLENPSQIVLGAIEEVPSLLTGGVVGKGAVTLLSKNIINESAERFMKSDKAKDLIQEFGDEVGVNILAKDLGEVAARKLLQTKQGRDAARKAATNAGVSTAAIEEAMSNAMQTKAEVLNLSEEEIKDEPIYKAYREQGMSHEKALQETSQRAFDIVTALVLPTAGAISKITGAGGLEGRVFLKDSALANTITSKLSATGIEGVEEGIQGATGQFAQNFAAQETFDQDRNLSQGVGQAIGEGAVIGAGTGVILGSVGDTGEVINSTIQDGKALSEKASNAIKTGAKALERATDAPAVKEARRTGDATAVTDTTSEAYNPEQAFATLASKEFFPTKKEEESEEDFNTRADSYFDELEVHREKLVEANQALINQDDPKLDKQIKDNVQIIKGMNQTITGLSGSLGKNNFDEVVKELKTNPETKDMLLGSMRKGLDSPVTVEQAEQVLRNAPLTPPERKQVESFIQSKKSSQEVSEVVRNGEKNNLGLDQYTQLVNEAVGRNDADSARTALKKLGNFASIISDKAKKARQAYDEVNASSDLDASQNISGNNGSWSLNISKNSAEKRGTPESLITGIENDAKALKATFQSLRDYSTAKFAPENAQREVNVRGNDTPSNASGVDNATGSQQPNNVPTGNQPEVQSDNRSARGSDANTQQDGTGNAGRGTNDNALEQTNTTVTPTATQTSAPQSNLTQRERILANEQARAAKRQEDNFSEIVELRAENKLRSTSPEAKTANRERIKTLQNELKRTGLKSKAINDRVKALEEAVTDTPATRKRLEEDSLATMLAKEGGLDSENWEDLPSEFGGLKKQGELPTGGLRLFKAEGRSPDAAAERANELGYGDGNWDANSIIAAISDELNGGEVVYTAEGQNIVMDRVAAENAQDEADRVAREAQTQGEVEQVPPTPQGEVGTGETETGNNQNEDIQQSSNEEQNASEQATMQTENKKTPTTASETTAARNEREQLTTDVQNSSTGLLSTGRKHLNRLSKLFKVNPKENKMSLTTNVFDEVDSLEGLTEEQKVALKRMGKLRDLLATAMDKFVDMKPLLDGKDNPYAALDTNMVQYLLRDGTDSYAEGLDPNVLNLMTIAAAKWLATRGKETLSRTPKDIAEMLGLREDQLTPELIEHYMDAGIPSYLVTDNIGKDVVNALGLVLDKKNAPREARERMVQSVGSLVFMAMHDLQLIETKEGEPLPDEKAEFTEQFKKNREFDGAPKMSKMIESKNTAGVIGLYNQIEDVLEDLTSIENNYKMPSLTAPESVPKTNQRGTQQLTKSQREALKNYAQKAFKLDTDVIMMFDLVGDDVLKVAMGYDFSLREDANGKLSSNRTHATKLKGAKGKNNQIERSIENLKAFKQHLLDNASIDADFFFESVVDNNNRFRMNNKIVNPQGDKLHRAAMIMDGWEYTVDDERSRQLYMLAVGQSLGVGIDKLEPEESLRRTRKKLNDPLIKNAIEALKELRGGMPKSNEETIRLQKIVAGGVKAGGEGSHTLEGLISLMDYSVTKPFTSKLSIEIDGITNGTALATLLFAPDGSTSVLAKSGIFSDHNRDYGAYISKPENNDNYETLAEALTGKLQQIIAGTYRDSDDEPFDPKLVALLRPIGNILGKLGQRNDDGSFIDDPTYGLIRNVAKNPVLIGNYGAGDNKITAEFVEEVLSKVYTHIEEAVRDNDQARLDLIHRELSTAVYKLPRITVANGLNWTMDKKQTAFFKSAVKKTFGKMMNEVLKEQFAPLREARDNFNTMLNAANAMFRAAYDVEAEKIMKTEIPVVDINGVPLMDEKGEPRMKEKGYLTVADEEFLERKLAPYRPEIKHGQVRKGDSQNTHIPLNTTELVIDKDSKFAIEIPFKQDANIPNYIENSNLDNLDRVIAAYEKAESNDLNNARNNMVSALQTYDGKLTKKLKQDIFNLVNQIKNKKLSDKKSAEEARKIYRRMKPKSSRVYAAQRVYTQNGVKGTVYIVQGTDSAIMVDTLLQDYPAMNIYDAVIVNPMNAVQAGEVLNQSTIDITKQTKVYRNTAESLKQIMTKFTSDKNPDSAAYIARMQEMEYLENEVLNQAAKALEVNPMDLVREAMGNTNRVEARRKVMFDNIQYTLQYNFPNAGYNTTPEVRNAEYYVKEFVAEVKNSNISKLGSTPQSGNTSYSQNQTEHEVRSNTIVGLMLMLSRISGVKSSTAHAEYLMDLLGDTYNSFVTTTKLKVARGGNLNAGDYNLRTGDVRVATKSGGRTSPFEMGADEVFAHEMVHSMTVAGLMTNSLFSREVRRLFSQAEKQLTVDDFMEVGGTRAEAQERYDYIFENKDKLNGYSAGVFEFVAYGMTNESFRNILRDKVDPNTNPYDTDTSFLGRIQSLYSKLLDLLTNRVAKTSNLKADAKLNTLIGLMIKHEENARQQVYAATMTDKIEDGIKAGLINYVQQPLVEFLDKEIFTKPPTTRIKPVRAALTVAQGLAAVSKISISGNFGEFRKVLNKVAKRLGATENNLFVALLNEIQGRTPETNQFYQLARESRKALDQTRADIAANVKTHVRNQFGRDLTSEEEVSLTKVLVKTDLSELMDNYDAEEIYNLITDGQFLIQEIRDTERQLNQFGLDATWYRKMANSLGNFMATGEFTERFGLKNAHAISRLVGLNKNVPAHAEQAEILIDRLASLRAIEVTKREYPEDMDRVVQLFEEEFVRSTDKEDNGIVFTLLYHADYKKRALENLFAGNKMQTVKGYVREIYNPNKSFQVAPEADVDLMARDGFVRQGSVPKDPHDPNSLPMAIYVSNMGDLAPWQAGGVSLAGMTAKGTKYYETQANSTTANNTNPTPNVAKTIKQRKEQAARDIYSGNTSAFGRTTLTPIIDETGKVTDFHYLMKEDTKDLLERNLQLADVFGAMEGNMKSKVSGQEINTKYVEALVQDFRDNFGTNRELYSFVGLNSERGDLEELYKMMPPEMRAVIKRETGQDGIWVRDDIIKLVFGQRKFSVAHYFKEKAELREANTRLSNKYLTNIYRKMGSPRVAAVEQGWQEVIAFVKDTIVIKSIVTLLGNIASNNVLLWSLGVPIKGIVSNQERAIRYAEQYQANESRIQEIDRELSVLRQRTASTSNTNKIKQLEIDKTKLEDKQLTNPIDGLIKAGIYQSIIDDVEMLDDGFNYKTRLENWVAPVTSKAPEQLKTLAGYVTLSQDNKFYQFLRRSTQLSDFAARFALHEHNLSKGMDAQQSIDMIVDTFIDYDLPTHKGIEYLNSIGGVFFTKFFLRVQKVILYTLQNAPARFFGLHYLQELFGNISDIFDSFGLTKDIGFMFKTPIGALGGVPDMHPVINLLR